MDDPAHINDGGTSPSDKSNVSLASRAGLIQHRFRQQLLQLAVLVLQRAQMLGAETTLGTVSRVSSWLHRNDYCEERAAG